MTPRWPAGPVACFGDSYTAGTGGGRGSDLGTLLTSLVGVPCKSFGVAGETAEEGHRRLSDVLSAQPRLCVVEFGVNDAFRGYPQERCGRALERTLRDLQTSGVPCVLVGVRFADYGAAWDRLLRDLGERLQVPVLVDALAGILDDPRLGDGFHPNAAGYREVAQRIASLVRPVLSKTTF